MAATRLNPPAPAPVPASAQPTPTPTPTPTPLPPLSQTQRFRPYYAPYEVVQLVQLQAYLRVPLGEASWKRKEMTPSRIQQTRQTAMGFIERVGMRLGFPRRTIATAQLCWHRFHLHHPLKDFAYQDVSLASLLVASKLHDTLKKLREIQIAGWQVHQIVQGGNGLGQGDAQTLEAHRPHLIAIERLLLQAQSFNLNLHRSLDPHLSENVPQTDLFEAIVRLCLALGTSKRFAKLAFTLGVDLGRTLVALSWPPTVCAEGVVWLAKVLWKGGEEVVLEQGWAMGTIEDHTGSFQRREIAQSLVLVFLFLLPSPTLLSSLSSRTPTTTPSNASPSFSPSSFSPIENPRTTCMPIGGGGMSTGALSEKDKALQLMGVPITLAMAMKERGSPHPDVFTHVPLTEGEWQQVQIRLRGMLLVVQQEQEQERGPREKGEGSMVGKEALERWRGSVQGMKKIEDLKVERGKKDFERGERERLRNEALTNRGGVEGMGPIKVPSEEEEREREKARRPGSILYQF
ncbi:BQ2448_1940 [Microbotryum intermedium]|uniref:BQ2448_1940 protein n=1 Tax=Microbotryum intermedium TaxID=269621 RepID=A0A238F4M3_9BASI|nr:BQ2448_1940 [Microbotryum intermedium]